jgi:hypothetical protein
MRFVLSLVFQYAWVGIGVEGGSPSLHSYLGVKWWVIISAVLRVNSTKKEGHEGLGDVIEKLMMVKFHLSLFHLSLVDYFP